MEPKSNGQSSERGTTCGSSCLSPSSDSLGASKGTGLGKAAIARLRLNLMGPHLEGATRLAKLAIKVGG